MAVNILFVALKISPYVSIKNFAVIKIIRKTGREWSLFTALNVVERTNLKQI